MNSKTQTQNTTTLPNGYKMTELGPLPEEWEVVKLGEICKYKKGVKPKIISDKKKFNTLPYLTAKYFRENVIEYYVPYEKNYKIITVDENDIVLIWDGSNAGDVFKGLKGVLASTMVKFENAEELHAEYFYYYLKTKFKHLNSKTTGSTIPHVNKNFLENLQIPLPPLSEQCKIAAILATVQKAIETEGKLIERTKELKKSMMHKLFTQGTKGEKQKMTEIGPIPESWEVVEVGKVYNIQQGKQVSKKNRIGNRQRYFLRTANVLWGHIDITSLDLMHFTSEEEKKYKLEIGDLLVCEGGAIGRTAIWENNIDNCYYQNHLHRLRVKVNNIFPKFHLYWFWYAFEFANIYFGQGNTTTIPNLSSSRLSLLKIPTPSFIEQQAIADILTTIDKKIEYHTGKKQKLEEFFRTLLHELMTAQKRVDKINLDFLKMEE